MNIVFDNGRTENEARNAGVSAARSNGNRAAAAYGNQQTKGTESRGAFTLDDIGRASCRERVSSPV